MKKLKIIVMIVMWIMCSACSHEKSSSPEKEVKNISEVQKGNEDEPAGTIDINSDEKGEDADSNISSDRESQGDSGRGDDRQSSLQAVIADNKNPKVVNKKSAVEIVDEIKAGWNLGNSLDACNTDRSISDTETGWGNPVTTKAVFDAVKAAGFNAVRIPVTYYNHMDASGNISKEWLDRVEEVVNYALSDDLYVIINVHHDAGMDSKYNWIYTDADNYAANEQALLGLWRQIADRFKDYDNRLMFEGVNEIMNPENNWDWGVAWEDFRSAHDLCQAFINLVRTSGGRNADRVLLISTFGASTDSAPIEHLFYKEFTNPNGGKEKNIILDLHNYAKDKGSIDYFMDYLGKAKSTYDIPVIMGEFGTDTGMSDEKRAESAGYYVKKAKSMGIKCFVWDDGGSYRILDRSSCQWQYPELLSALINAAQ